jgi:hypothetical protein
MVHLFPKAQIQEFEPVPKISTRQLHESFAIKWLCKYECRTHRESGSCKLILIPKHNPNLNLVPNIKHYDVHKVKHKLNSMLKTKK